MIYTKADTVSNQFVDKLAESNFVAIDICQNEEGCWFSK